MILQAGMKVKIKNIPEDYKNLAGKTKTITKILSPLGKFRAFGLEDTNGIWIIKDFDKLDTYKME